MFYKIKALSADDEIFKRQLPNTLLQNYGNQLMQAMTYKGYTARIKYDDQDNVFVGKLVGMCESICFYADNLNDLRIAFAEAVIDYREVKQKSVAY